MFNTAEYGAEVREVFTSPDKWTPGTTTEKTVTVKNTGNIDMAVRASYVEKWEDANGNEISLKDSENNVASIIHFNTGWTKDDDGYYYFGSKANLTRLEPNNTSTSFISGVTFNENIKSSLEKSTSADGKTITYSSKGDSYDGGKYTLTINIDTIQYDQASSVWS